MQENNPNWNRIYRYTVMANPAGTVFSFDRELGEMKYHFHEFDEILLVRSGHITILTPNVFVTHRGTCLIFYKNHVPHTQINRPDVDYDRYCIQAQHRELFPLIQGALPLSSIFHREAALIPLEGAVTERLWRCMEMLSDIPYNGIENADRRVRLLLEYFFTEINEAAHKTEPLTNVLPDPYLGKVLGYISEHITERIPLSRLTEHFGVGKTKLCRDFLRYLSVPVETYIMDEKLTAVQTALKEGSTVEEAALRFGFTDSSHLVRTFRRYRGTTPARYKHRFLAGDETL